MSKLTSWMLIMLLALPALLQLADNGHPSMFVRAEEDEADGEDDGVVEEESDATEAEAEAEAGAEAGSESEKEGGDEANKNVHSDAETTLLFTNPPVLPSPDGGQVELPAGKIVEFIVGFNNKGEETDFTIDSMDASFRYPMDYSYHIQNFSSITYNKRVKSGQEASVFYSFIPADAFAGRPIGLTINLAYRDGEGNSFFDPVFNETVQIVEFDEGFDTEVFFMYVFLAAGALLVLFLIYSFAIPKSKGKKKPASKPVESGTTHDDVDYEWIPRSALNTPGGKTSPRQRKNKRGTGSDTE